MNQITRSCWTYSPLVLKRNSNFTKMLKRVSSVRTCLKFSLPVQAISLKSWKKVSRLLYYFYSSFSSINMDLILIVVQFNCFCLQPWPEDKQQQHSWTKTLLEVTVSSQWKSWWRNAIVKAKRLLRMASWISLIWQGKLKAIRISICVLKQLSFRLPHIQSSYAVCCVVLSCIVTQIRVHRSFWSEERESKRGW